MSWCRRIGQPHSKQWVTCFMIAVSVTCVNFSEGRERKKVSPETSKIDKKRIIEPISSMMPEYPEEAYDAYIGAEVWARFKIDNEKGIDSVEVISCSVDSFGFEEAAINWIMTGHFLLEPGTMLREKDWWYTKLDYMPEKWDWHLRKIHALEPPKYIPDTANEIDDDSDFVPVEIMPELTFKGVPSYPMKAKKSGKSCTVHLRVLILRDGLPGKVLIEKTSDPNWLWGFNEAAIKGVKDCRFKPAIQNGKPVNVWVSFPYEFSLKR